MEKIKERGKIYAIHKASNKLKGYYGSAMLSVVQFDGHDIQCAYVDGYLYAKQELEVKEVDLEKEIKEQIDTYYENCNKKLEEMGEDDNDISFLTLDGFARHFYELGLKAKGE